MKSPFKYSGGKTKEIPFIETLLPTCYDNVVEPFSGSAAVSFFLEKPSVVCDTRLNNIATFRSIRDNFDDLNDWCERLRGMSQEELKDVYYYQRDEMFDKCETDLDYAKRWIVLRQLAFSGMDRINSKNGKFNAPFGWYKKFTTNLNKEHSEFLKKCVLMNDDFEVALGYANEKSFIFLDPPYYGRNSDYGGDYSENLHKRIYDGIKNISSSFMIVHVDCDMYRDLYEKDFNIVEKEYTYSQNFKGRDNKKSFVKHLYITNY